MNFSDALRRMKLGAKIRRREWKTTWWTVVDGKLVLKVADGKDIFDSSADKMDLEDIMADDWIDPAE